MNKIKTRFNIIVFLLAILLLGCTKQEKNILSENTIEVDQMINVKIGKYNFSAKLATNMATEKLIDILEVEPITINMHDYSGFEKVGELGFGLPAVNSRITTKPGDIVLYNGDSIVMFYGSNTWNYTMLGHIEDLTNWEEALGSDDIVAEISLSE